MEAKLRAGLTGEPPVNAPPEGSERGGLIEMIKWTNIFMGKWEGLRVNIFDG